MFNQTKRILVVEDEPEIRQLICLHLKRSSFDFNECGDGETAIKLLNQTPFDLVILDWMVPQKNGLEITRWMRSRPQLDRTPILFVTAKADPEHVATGLDAGADDYLGKPFDTIVLMARVHALLRRNQWLNETPKLLEEVPQLIAGEITLYPNSMEAFCKGQKIDLTRSEFKLLESLLQNRGKVLTREALINSIQGDGVNVIGRTIDTHVFGLRKKLNDQGELIETIRGVGYRVRFDLKGP